jgi:hypothetical protein
MNEFSAMRLGILFKNLMQKHMIVRQDSSLTLILSFQRAKRTKLISEALSPWGERVGVRGDIACRLEPLKKKKKKADLCGLQYFTA